MSFSCDTKSHSYAADLRMAKPRNLPPVKQHSVHMATIFQDGVLNAGVDVAWSPKAHPLQLPDREAPLRQTDSTHLESELEEERNASKVLRVEKLRLESSVAEMRCSSVAEQENLKASQLEAERVAQELAEMEQMLLDLANQVEHAPPPLPERMDVDAIIAAAERRKEEVAISARRQQSDESKHRGRMYRSPSPTKTTVASYLNQGLESKLTSDAAVASVQGKVKASKVKRTPVAVAGESTQHVEHVGVQVSCNSRRELVSRPTSPASGEQDVAGAVCSGVMQRSIASAATAQGIPQVLVEKHDVADHALANVSRRCTENIRRLSACRESGPRASVKEILPRPVAIQEQQDDRRTSGLEAQFKGLFHTLVEQRRALSSSDAPPSSCAAEASGGDVADDAGVADDLRESWMWGISMQQLLDLRDEILPELEDYCSQHGIFCMECGTPVHVCLEDKCSYGDHSGVKFVAANELPEGKAWEHCVPNMHIVVDRFLKPRTKISGKSFALGKNPQGMEITTFVTHCWNEKFGDLVNALSLLLRPEEELWMCSLAVAQYETTSIEDLLQYDLDNYPCMNALQHATKHVVVVDSKLEILHRAWCLFEIEKAQHWVIPSYFMCHQPHMLQQFLDRADEVDIRVAQASNVMELGRIQQHKEGGHVSVRSARVQGYIMQRLASCVHFFSKLDVVPERMQDDDFSTVRRQISEEFLRCASSGFAIARPTSACQDLTGVSDESSQVIHEKVDTLTHLMVRRLSSVNYDAVHMEAAALDKSQTLVSSDADRVPAADAVGHASAPAHGMQNLLVPGGARSRQNSTHAPGIEANCSTAPLLFLGTGSSSQPSKQAAGDQASSPIAPITEGEDTQWSAIAEKLVKGDVSAFPGLERSIHSIVRAELVSMLSQ